MNNKSADKPNLTTKQMAFVCAYLQCFNATKAAKQAGYSEESAFTIGPENLKKPLIAAEISKRLDTEGITPERIKVAWSEIAFDSDMADFEVAIHEGVSLKTLRDNGYNTKLIKSLSVGRSGTRIEFYSRTDALDKITKIAGMYVDKIEHSGRIDSLVSTEKFEDMDDDRKARFLRTAGVTDVLAPGHGADTGSVDSGEK